MKKRIALFVAVAVVMGTSLSAFSLLYSHKLISPFTAGPFFVPSTSKEKLAETYVRAATPATAQKVKILIIPGHDDASPGAAYKNIKEKDVTVLLAKELASVFADDPYFEITLARDENGYNKALIPHFLNTEEVRLFKETHQKAMSTLVDGGIIERRVAMVRNNAFPATALRLYAINKWANENGFDLIVNIHFNDHPRKNLSLPGKHSGFSIYVPERQYSNSLPSIEIGNYIKTELEKLFPVSNHPQERVGVVEDQELIALGSNNTVDAAVVLIEYDYIYSPALHNETVRPLLFKEYAQKTYDGLKKYFTEISGIANNKEYVSPPYIFAHDLELSETPLPDVFFLQVALTRAGVYPPAPYTRYECPLTGKFGECTRNAVKLFQEKYSLTPTGIVGSKTREILNAQMY